MFHECRVIGRRVQDIGLVRAAEAGQVEGQHVILARQPRDERSPIARAIVADAMNQHHRLFVLAAGLVDMRAALEDRLLDHGRIAERRGGFGLVAGGG